MACFLRMYALMQYIFNTIYYSLISHRKDLEFRTFELHY